MGQPAEIHELRRLRKRVALPIPDSACSIIGALGLFAPDTIGRVAFSLRRRKGGTEIWMHAPQSGGLAFSWNLSVMLDIHPPSFREARSFVLAYGARHGQLLEERRKERIKRATGQDRIILKNGGCREEWLKSDVPTLWAEAMMRCGHAGGFCGQDGYCHLGNCDMEMNEVSR
jgi:hypothetical protein